MFDLNDEQRPIAHTVDRHVLVAAGAGTGKTRAVVGRLLYLLGVEVGGETIADPVPLERLAAITYTNAAAADLVRKLRDALRDTGRRDLAWRVDTARIGTIHRFCGDLLREFALRRGRNPSPAILEDGEARALAQESARDALIACLEADTIAGLGDLVADRGADKVEGFVIGLLERSDVLRRHAAGMERLGPQERVLVQLAAAARDLVERRLDEEGAVDFDRMLTWTRDLLRDDSLARAAIRRRLHTLIVDEFQDTDPVQQEIAYLVGDPLANDPATTRLLLVGDPKQSIYSFRFADVSGWRRVERDFESGAGKVMPLSGNYRSTSQVLDFVAATAGRALATPADGAAHAPFEIPFAPVLPAEDRQQGGAPVEALVLRGFEGGVGEARSLEAEWVACRARELHDEGVAWSEMAVLLPAWDPAEAIRDALHRQGAPVWIARDEGFLERREVVDCIVALEAVREPEDDRALFGFLRSPFAGVKDETLFAVADALRQGPFWPHLRSGGGPAVERLRQGIALLERLTALRDRVTVDELLTDLLEATGYLAHLALLGEDRAQAIANVRKFVRMARGERRAGVGEFLLGVAEMRERGDRVADAPLHGEHEDVVTIASIHTAKGLEWDVVFWCDVTRGPPGLKGNVLITPDVLVLKDNDGWADARARAILEQNAERKRMWYVAATRAKRRLIVSALGVEPPEKLKPHQAAYWLQETVPMEPRVVDVATLMVEAEAVEPAPLGDLAAFAGPRAPVPVPLGRPRHSATEYLAHARCERRHWYKYVVGLREPEVRRGGKEFISAIARGQIVHDVLEELREQDQLDALLEDAIGRWDPDAPPPESPTGGRYRRELRDEIRLIADHPDYRAIADRPGAVRELKFVRVTPEAEIFEGAMDLAAPDGDGHLILLDVKTPQKVEEQAVREIAEHYAPQRDVYVTVAEAVGGAEVGRFAFQFSKAARQVATDVTPALRVEMTEAVAARLKRMAQGKPQLTAFPKECGFCGYKKAGWCEGGGVE